MIARILVPLDGSMLARTALDVATRIADPTCEIILLTAVQIPEFPVYAASPLMSIDPDCRPTLDALRDDAARYLREIADSLREQNHNVRVRVEVGEPAHMIVQTASTENVDMIVMSTHGRSGISRWLFGSVTNRVLGMAPRPVLVVPSRETQQQHEHEITEMTVG